MGIAVTGSATSLSLIGNTIRGATTGIAISAASTGTIIGNDVQATATGVSFNGTVQFNHIARGTTGLVAVNNQLVAYNVFDQIGTTSLPVTGKSYVQIISNTFYSATASHVVASGASSDIEVRDNVFWTD